MIKLPLYRDRYLRGLLYSFILSMNRATAEINIEGDDIIIKHGRGDEATFFIADVFKVAYEKCSRGGLKVSFSGNDKRYILPKILNELSLPPDIRLCEMIKTVGSMVKDLNDTEFNKLFYGGRSLAPLSILRVEHYAVGRLPYFKSLDLNRRYPSSDYAPLKYSVIESMMLLAGYILGKCGEAYRGGVRTSLILLPTYIYSARVQFYRLIDIFVRKYLPPGLEPEYSLYLWLLMTLPRELESVDIYGIKEPAGMRPSEPVFETEVNIAGLDEMVKVIKMLIDYYKGDVLYILKASLGRDTNRTNIKEFASRYARYLYRLISPDYEACRDLLYVASRDNITLHRHLTKLKEDRYKKNIEIKLELARRAHRISQGLIKTLSTYRVPSL